MISDKINDTRTYVTLNTDGFKVSGDLLKPGIISVPSSDLTLSIDGSIDWKNFNRYNIDVEIVDQNHYGAKEKVKTTCSRFNNDVMPDKIIYNGDTTILISDDDKYVVKCTDGDKFDPVFGFLYGYFLMNNGMSKTQAAKFFKHLEKCAVDDMPKLKKVEEIVNDKSMTLDEYEKMMREVLGEFIA